MQGTSIAVRVLTTGDKAPMLAELRITNTGGQCPDTAYKLTTYTLQQGKLSEAKDVMPGIPFEPFFKKGFDLKKVASRVIPDQDYRVGYKLPQKGTTVEAFLDVETASCALGVFGDQMTPAQRNADKAFLQNVSKETMKLTWSKTSGKFDLPPGVTAAEAPDKSALPRYADHPVKEQFSGKPASPDLKSDPEAKRFASVLSEGTKNGPNFAGSYTIVQWGCGAGCQSFMIVDAKNGSIHTPRFSAERGLCFRKDSSLLIADPITREFLVNNVVPEQYKTNYYLWDGKKLSPIAESRSVMTPDANCG
jgi:hypothetical protein